MEINTGKQYTTLEISLKLDCLEKGKGKSSVPSDYMGISGQGIEEERHGRW